MIQQWHKRATLKFHTVLITLAAVLAFIGGSKIHYTLSGTKDFYELRWNYDDRAGLRMAQR